MKPSAGHGLSGTFFLLSLLCFCIILHLAGCSADDTFPMAGESATGAESQLRPPTTLDFAAALSDVRKLLADDEGEFAAQRTGAEFAEDLPLSRCEVQGSAALLDPAWQLGKPNQLDSAAYCLYRLRLYPTLDAATLTLEWAGYPPPAGSCWIGLVDWQRMCWQWQLLPESNALELNDMTVWASNQAQCYAAVMLLDYVPRQLQSIGFGDIEPPEPPAQYNLFDPMMANTTFLIDMEGNEVQSWDCGRVPATCSYLLPTGNLLRPGRVANPAFGNAAGGGGIIEEFDWEGNVVWSFTLSNDIQLMHHDIEPLPNGNILAIVWERKTEEEAILAGRHPELIPLINARMDIDSIVEIQPRPEGGGEIVWEWHLWDHLIQDYNPELENFGDVGAHPELANFNYPETRTADYSHFNGVDYNADLDQIAVTAHGLSEIWIIDHSTTTAEAAGHEGGLCGQGGDLLYRWGNPEAYGAGAAEDQMLFGGHNVTWIPNGAPGAGDLLVFNNGIGRPLGTYSTVDQITPPLEPDGTYYQDEGLPFGPAELAWSYMHDPPGQFYSWYISGAQRLPNGNTVICSGAGGDFFEVTPSGETVWEYSNPFTLYGGYAVFRVTRLFGNFPGLSALLPPSE